MKKIFLILFLLISTFSFSQGVDVPVSITGDYAVLVSGSTITGQQNYIFAPPVSYSIVNFIVRQSLGSRTGNTITISETSDPSVTTYAGNTTKWNTDQNFTWGRCTSSFQTSVCSFIVRNAAQVALSFTPGTSSGTYDLILDFSNKSFISPLMAYTSIANTATTQIQPLLTDGSGNLNVNIAKLAIYNDPCKDPTLARFSQQFNISGTTTQQVVIAGGSTTYVCSIIMSLGGTNPTAQFGSATNGNCGISPTQITGPIGFNLQIGSYTTIFATSDNSAGAGARDVCITLTGTSPTASGIISFVIK